MDFTGYLERKGFGQGTVDSHNFIMGIVLGWCRSSSVDIGSMTYNDIMAFVKSCSDKNVSTRRVNRYLCTIRYYYNFLSLTNPKLFNPARGLFIKGGVVKVPSNLLTMYEMEEMFMIYCYQLSASLSKKVMVGLMIFQGMTTNEIAMLELGHVKIKECLMFIVGSKTSNERVVPIHRLLIPHLSNYIQSTNLKDCTFIKAKSKNNIYGKKIRNKLKYLFDQLRRINPKAKSLTHIRMSILTEWLKTDNLKEVQYKAGIRFLSSLERYQYNDIEKLQKDFKSFHPLG